MIVNGLLLLTIIDLVFGAFVYLSNRRRPINIFYGLAVLSVGLWSFGLFMFFRTAPADMRFWSNFLYVAGSLIVGNFFAFSLIFPFERWPWGARKTFLIYVPNILLFVLLFFSDFVIKGVSTSSVGVRNIQFGQLYFFYWMYFLIFLVSSFVIILRRYFQASGIERLQLGYVFVGSSILALFGTVTNLWLPTFGNFDLFWLGPYFSIFLVFLLAIAIFKYRLFDIRVISAEIFSAAIIIFFLVQLIRSGSFNTFLLNGFFLVGVVVFSYFLLRSVFQEIKQGEEISKLAEDLKKANLELKKLDQLKSEFVSLASHQLRTPLTVIKGYISMIHEGSFGQVSEGLKDALRKIYISNEHLISLVGDFLNLSRIESGKMQYIFEPLNLGEMVRGVYEEFKEIAKEKKLELTYELPKNPLPQAMIDKEKFRQVIMNLIDNAVKYTKDGFIKLKIEEEARRPEGPFVLISVSDSGIGISSENMDTIFKRFSRGEEGTRANTGGLGLGLYLAKRIVTDHGGEIWAESKGLNQGSVFRVRLPARADIPVRPPPS